MTPAPGRRSNTGRDDGAGTLVEIDGSLGEGGGQVLRSSLTLSLVTGRPFRIERIRARRQKPGLMPQHLTAVQAAAKVGKASVEGAERGSSTLRFEPNVVRHGDYHFDIGTAGSTTLVLQTVLPALALAGGPSRLSLEGGTHNLLAPPFDFLQQAWLPILRRQGPRVEARLVRAGFYPRGGGRLEATVEPVPALRPIQLAARGEARGASAVAYVASLADSIARRELETVQGELGWPAQSCRTVRLTGTRSPGNHLSLFLEYEHVTEVFAGFGRRGVQAEVVAREAVRDARRYLATEAPVGKHLADQLVLLCALSGGGSFRTLPPTQHTRTNLEVVQHFCPLEVDVEPVGESVWRIELGPRSQKDSPS